MIPGKPRKTLADQLVISISPVLIMLLVGSLSFFLIQVFFRGEAVGSVRWVMFWFVLAIVLVSRIGIEQGETHAAIYGGALAIATWFYLMRVHPAFLLGMLLLGIVWWCANKLVWDCTLIDEDADASGGGLLETAGERKNEPPPPPKKQKPKGSRTTQDDKTSTLPIGPPITNAPHSPGLWVVYFSMAALPIFGIGQMLIPRNDAPARHAGFTYLFVYVAAGLGLLLTTSFLGLRRYLRQRFLEMPGAIAFGWVRFGVGVAVLVLVGALLLPRPGVTQAWVSLRYHIDHQLRNASRYAMQISPHGKGAGRAGKETSADAKNDSDTTKPQDAKEKSSTPDDTGKAPPSDGQKSPPLAEPSEQVYHLFRILFVSVAALAEAWWLIRKRELFFQMARGFWAAVLKFFQDLLGIFTFQKRQSEIGANIRESNFSPFASYHNPFLTGGEKSWTHEKIVLYSFEALQAWAEEKGIQPRPEQTAWEFCEEVAKHFPEIYSALYGLSFLYGYAAYGEPAPSKYDLAPVKDLWQFFYRGNG
jgi:hypothetical protein